MYLCFNCSLIPEVKSVMSVLIQFHIEENLGFRLLDFGMLKLLFITVTKNEMQQKFVAIKLPLKWDTAIFEKFSLKEQKNVKIKPIIIGQKWKGIDLFLHKATNKRGGGSTWSVVFKYWTVGSLRDSCPWGKTCPGHCLERVSSHSKGGEPSRGRSSP